eukprot:6446862-Amphidinium_carterae.1
MIWVGSLSSSLETKRKPCFCTLEGDAEHIYAHTEGTFDVAHAAYWWGRVAALRKQVQQDRHHRQCEQHYYLTTSSTFPYSMYTTSTTHPVTTYNNATTSSTSSAITLAF